MLSTPRSFFSPGRSVWSLVARSVDSHPGAAIPPKLIEECRRRVRQVGREPLHETPKRKPAASAAGPSLLPPESRGPPSLIFVLGQGESLLRYAFIRCDPTAYYTETSPGCDPRPGFDYFGCHYPVWL